MLLALWFDFWTLSDWTPAPPVVVTTQRQQLGGPGKKRRERYYSRADADWWEEYEKMLKRLHHVEVREDAPEKIQKKATEANRLIDKVKTHTPPDLDSLRRVDARIVELTSQIEEYELQSRDEEDAILALLL